MFFDVFGLAVIVSDNSCQDITKMACTLIQGHISHVKVTVYAWPMLTFN